MLSKTVKLEKWGNSQGIRLGEEELKELGAGGADVVFDMTITNGKIILIPQKKYPTTLEELFEGFEDGPLPKKERFDWGESAGKELL